MIIIKKISFAILITAFIFSLTKFYSKQIAPPRTVTRYWLVFNYFYWSPNSYTSARQTFRDNEEAIEFGNIKWFNSRKGYGFISADQGDEIFVHFRNFTGKETNNIREGQRVKFVTVSSEKGLQADKVSFV